MNKYFNLLLVVLVLAVGCSQTPDGMQAEGTLKSEVAQLTSTGGIVFNPATAAEGTDVYKDLLADQNFFGQVAKSFPHKAKRIFDVKLVENGAMYYFVFHVETTTGTVYSTVRQLEKEDNTLFYTPNTGHRAKAKSQKVSSDQPSSNSSEETVAGSITCIPSDRGTPCPQSYCSTEPDAGGWRCSCGASEQSMGSCMVVI